MIRSIFALAAALAVSFPDVALAQCPDGAPPPCRSTQSAIARRAAPQLNTHAWIVVPFANVMKAPDLDWLRDASVNLLSLDLSRWTDIAVVDDKRVGDLVRELPPARTAGALTLNDGLALARRAGAGTLVMGDFYRLGAGARIAANVFDVKTGARVRSVTQQANSQDSLLTAFGPLARAVLALPPPADTKLGATGTSSVDAYQEYLLGSKALNRFELTDAVRHLRKSLSLDSNFAMAHYKLSLAFHLDTTGNAAERVHALAAARLGSALPVRERALLAARVAAAIGDDPRACATLRTLVARDSSDVEAMYALGDCEYHGMYSTPIPIDTYHASPRGNWNTAIRLFRRVLLLDPGYHPAFAHVLDMLTKGRVTICQTAEMVCGNNPTSWTAAVIRDGDSLLIQPVSLDSLNKQMALSERTRSRYANLRAAEAIAHEWAETGPGEGHAHVGLAIVQMLLGAPDSADAELQLVGRHSDARRDALLGRVDMSILLGRGAVARALLDTLRREVPGDSPFLPVVAVRGAAVGRVRWAEAAVATASAGQQWSPERTRYMLNTPRALLGVPSPTLNEDEHRYWMTLTGEPDCGAGSVRCRTTALLPTMAYAARAPRTWWPPFNIAPFGFRFEAAYGIATANMDSLRANVKFLDSLSHARFAGTSDDQMTAVIGADAALAMHDSATALRMARYFTDSLLPALERSSTGISFLEGWRILFVPRMMLQRADLAAAMGFPAEARTWYARVLDLWAGADPELQPTVTRIRAAMTKLRKS